MFNFTLVVTGIAIFGYSIYIHVKFLNLVKGTPFRKWWIILLVLVLFFTLGYIVYAYWLTIGIEVISLSFLRTLVSFIFFFGAIFVALTILFIYSTIKDLTNRTRELEEAKNKISEGWLDLQQEKAKLAASINSLSMGFMLVDIEGNTFISNPAIEKIFGIHPTGVRSIKEIDDQLPEINLVEAIEKSRNERKNFEKKDVILGNGGRFLRIFINPITLMDGAENVIGSVILFEDITEARVIERSRDEFFSIASHELRTPLTAIRGNIALIRDNYLEKIKDPEFSEMISDIHESSIRLIGIVNDFLNMSRLEMGKMEFKKESVNIGQTTQEVINELKGGADEKKLYIKSTLTADLPSVLADKDKVREVLVNLIGNGIKYTEAGGVAVSGDVQEGFLKIAVADTGRGIPKENQSFLFHKFQQAESNLFTRDTTKGTGLGLYISKLMIEGMGGTIGIEKSETGKGSTFIFTLPLATIAKTKTQAV